VHKWHLDIIFFHKIAAKRAQYMQYSRAQAVERKKLGADGDRKDFFHYLLNARDPETGKGFTETELWGESNLFIIAGSDTTSAAMAGTFFYLVHNPAALARVTAEVRAAFANAEHVTHGPALTNCKYLRACIDESMRLSPPVAGGLPRCVLDGGMVIDDCAIPAGVDVCVPHYAIHHNAAYFPQPFDYIPERWLPEQATVDLASKADDAHSAFCPFSVGPRGCIGKGLAYVELMVTVAKVLVAFEMRLAPGSHVGEGRADLEEGRRRVMEYQLKDTFTSMKDGPMVQFRRSG